MSDAERPERHEVALPDPPRPTMVFRPPDEPPGFGERPRTLAVSFTHVEAYEGELWACDICGAAVAEWPDDHPFIHRDGDDSFQVHARWHRRLGI